jgi:hypothetical protein
LSSSLHAFSVCSQSLAPLCPLSKHHFSRGRAAPALGAWRLPEIWPTFGPSHQILTFFVNRLTYSTEGLVPSLCPEYVSTIRRVGGTVVGSRSSNRVCGESLKTSCLRSRLLAGLCGHRVRGNARERPESARVLSVHPGFGEGRFSTTPYEPFEIIGAGQNRPCHWLNGVLAAGRASRSKPVSSVRFSTPAFMSGKPRGTIARRSSRRSG